MYIAPGFLERLLAFTGVLVALALFIGFALSWGQKAKEEKDPLPLKPSDKSPSETETKSILMTDVTAKEPSTMPRATYTDLRSTSPGTPNARPLPTALLAEQPFLSSASWALMILCALLCAASLWIASSISNYGSIADLQAQTNVVLFAVVVALASIAVGIAAVFLRLCARPIG